MSRHRLFMPILLGALSILLTIAVIVGWNVMFTKYYALRQQTQLSGLGTGFWLILSIGDLFLAIVLAVLVTFLVSNIRKELLVARQNTFIDSVTHELKSPIASLKLALETLSVREVPVEVQRRFVANMREDVGRLQRFVEAILEAGRLEHGTREMAFEPVDPVALAHACVERAQQQHLLDAGKIRLVSAIEGPCTLLADPVALETVLLNLLDNAIKYSFDDVSVEVHLEQAYGYLGIRVTDHGVGIPANKLKKIFRRFYRLQHPGTHRVRGTGLGLYLAAMLVERLGGRIWATSDGLGSGSTFHVTLPTAPPLAESGPDEAAALALGRG